MMTLKSESTWLKDSKEIGYIDNNNDHSKEFTYTANND